jgi:Tfp pilus assembly protein PilF
VRYYNNKGVILAKDERYDDAIKLYEMALRFFPKYKENYRILYNVALSYMKMRTPDAQTKAVMALKKATELNPGFTKAKEALSKLNVAA